MEVAVCLWFELPACLLFVTSWVCCWSQSNNLILNPLKYLLCTVEAAFEFCLLWFWVRWTVSFVFTYVCSMVCQRISLLVEGCDGLGTQSSEVHVSQSLWSKQSGSTGASTNEHEMLCPWSVGLLRTVQKSIICCVLVRSCQVAGKQTSNFSFRRIWRQWLLKSSVTALANSHSSVFLYVRTFSYSFKSTEENMKHIKMVLSLI